MSEITFKPAERETARNVWMAVYKNALALVPVSLVPVGSLVVMHFEDELGDESEPYESYWPFVVLSHTTRHTRLACILEVEPGGYCGTTINLNHQCAMLR